MANIDGLFMVSQTIDFQVVGIHTLYFQSIIEYTFSFTI